MKVTGQSEKLFVLQLTKEFLQELRCPACHGRLASDLTAPNGSSSLECAQCCERFPVIHEIPRMLLSPLREALLGDGQATGNDAKQVETALSFGYEWTQFSEMYDEWESNFHQYMGPRREEFFRGKRVLDAGCGTGRHTFYAAKYGADVWAADLGPAVEVARRNNEGNKAVKVVQADLYRLPFAPESFDFIYSLGVLHHLPEPEAAFRNLLSYLKPDGEINVFLYWKPEDQPIKSALLSLVTMIRRITTTLPHNVIHALSFPAALVVFAFFVWPYRVMKRLPVIRSLAERMPMKQYAQYPFRVCVNDQLDRFSAPIENRYTKAEVEAWSKRAGLENVEIRPNFGWVISGRKTGRRDAEVVAATGTLVVKK